ncbi:MAG: hypothetical protein OJF51_001865 [Nitrospira sp.]|nr:MAG: hypothetical protein OJF51_001865 [Nitrospira sp.]
MRKDDMKGTAREKESQRAQYVQIHFDPIHYRSQAMLREKRNLAPPL